MGYHPMDQTDMYEMVRRWHDGQTVSEIARTGNRDRKTVREVIRKASETGVSKDKTLPDKDILCAVFEDWRKKKERNREVYDEFVKHEDEIKKAIEGSQDFDSMKPKTAFLCMQEKYGLKGSYGTFKIFARKRGFGRDKSKATLRIEMEPGKEAQIDYGKMGLIPDIYNPGKKRVVNGFIMVLSHCRLPFIQFTFTQKDYEFAGSIQDGFIFFNGVPERLSLDNLKSGVIKPDLYDPKFNRTFQELVEHYATFADPCRVATATDKGKVERHVPVARELFRFLRYTHPDAPLAELNRLAKDWCMNTYGQRLHGTTRLKPKTVFDEIEKAKLKPLPPDKFEISKWKEAIVHRDQFLQFEYKTYSMPESYVGQTLWMRKCGRMMAIYRDFTKLREYVIPQGRYAHTPDDFPKEKQDMMHGKYPSYIMSEAKAMGETAELLMRKILEPHAYVKSRRGRGILEVMRKYRNEPFFEKVCRTALEGKVHIPKIFEQIMKDESDQLNLPFEVLPISAEGAGMIRDANYYIQEDTLYESTTSLGDGFEEAEALGHGAEFRNAAKGGAGERFES